MRVHVGARAVFWEVFRVLLIVLIGGGGRAQESRGSPETPIAKLEPISAKNCRRLELIRQLGEGRAFEIAWSPDGEFLALRSSLGVSTYRVVRKQRRVALADQGLLNDGPARYTSLSCGGDGELLAACDSTPTIRIWDLRSRQVHEEIEVPGAEIVNLRLDRSGRLLAASGSDGRLRIWRNGAFQEGPEILQAPQRSMRAHSGVRFSRDGKWVAAWYSIDVYVWRVKDGTLIRTFSARTGTTAYTLYGADFHPREAELAGFTYNSAFRWSLDSGLKIAELSLGSGLSRGATFDPSGRFFLLTRSNAIQRMDPQSGSVQTIGRVEDQDYYVQALCEPKAGRLLAALFQEKLELLDSANGRALWKTNLKPPSVAAISTDGDALVWGSSTQDLKLLNLGTAESARQLSCRSLAALTSLALSPKAQYLAAVTRAYRNPSLLSLWRIRSGRLVGIKLPDRERKGVRSAVFSPDGQWLAIGRPVQNRAEIKLFSLKRKKLLPPWTISETTRYGAPLATPRFSPDSRRLAVLVSGAETVPVLDVPKGALAHRLILPRTDSSMVAPKDLTFGPRGEFLLVSSYAGTVWRFDLGTGKLVSTFELAGDRRPELLSVSPDGALLVSAAYRYARSGGDTNLVFVELPSGRQLAQVPAQLSTPAAVSLAAGGKLLISAGDDGTVCLWGVGQGAGEARPLIAALKQGSPLARYKAARALGRMRDARALEPLITALKDKDSDVRYLAADALGKIKDPRAVKPLTEALKDEDEDVRYKAAEALSRIRGRPDGSPR